MTHDAVNESEIRNLRSIVRRRTARRLIVERNKTMQGKRAKQKTTLLKKTLKANIKAALKKKKEPEKKKPDGAEPPPAVGGGGGAGPPVPAPQEPPGGGGGVGGPGGPPGAGGGGPVVGGPGGPPAAVPAPLPAGGDEDDDEVGADEDLLDFGNGKSKRLEPWGPWWIAEIYSKGVQNGWGAVCKEHKDPAKPNLCCKKAITFGTKQVLSNDACRRKMKEWLLWGESCRPDDRTAHVKRNMRCADLFPGESERDLDERALKSLEARIPALPP